MITIFSTNPPRPAKRSSAVAVSLLAHGVVFLVVALGVTYSHPDIGKLTARKYSVQFIHLQLSEPVQRQALQALRTPAVQQAVSHQFDRFRLHHARAKQTLIRPDIRPDVVLKQEISMAAVLPETANPLPIIPEFIPSPSSAPVLPQRPPMPKIEHAAAADVISLPNTPLRAQDLLVIPPASQIAGASAGAQSIPTPFEVIKAREDGNRSTSDVAPWAPSGQVPAASALVRAQGSTGPTETAGVIRLTQPKDGKFGIIVSGSSASDEFPESADVLSGNKVYTVYIRVGLRKNWILQYCLPKDAEPNDAAIDAPWPFLMLRPDPLRAADLDYIVVRGIINCDGRFEQLGLIYPSELSEQDKLLGALRQWTFRPANQGGQPVTVEALLVIPRQDE